MKKISIGSLCVLLGLFFMILSAYADEDRGTQCNAIAQIIFQDIVTYREGHKPLSDAYSAINSRKVSKEDARFQKEVLRVAYEYKTVSPSAFSVWSAYNCLAKKTTGQDFSMSIKQYGAELEYCSGMGVQVRLIADIRDKGATKGEYLAGIEKAQNELQIKGYVEGDTAKESKRMLTAMADEVYGKYKDLHGNEIELSFLNACILKSIVGPAAEKYQK